LCMPKVTCRPQPGWLSVAAAGPANLRRKGYPGQPHRRTPGQDTTRTPSSVPGGFQHLTFPHQAQPGGKLSRARRAAQSKQPYPALAIHFGQGAQLMPTSLTRCRTAVTVTWSNAAPSSRSCPCDCCNRCCP